jgi:hypothetical protein
MLFRTIVSAFFLPVATDGDFATLVRQAGMTDVAPLDETARGALGFHDPDRHVLGGTWGDFQETWAIADDVDGIRALQLYSPATRYSDASSAARRANAGEGTDSDGDDWPLAGYVRTFRDACLALAPRAAFLDTRAHFEDEAWVDRQGSRGLVLELAHVVAAGDADALAQRRFSLLFLDTGMAGRWTFELPWADREEVEVPAGRLIFARSGPTRMS